MTTIEHGLSHSVKGAVCQRAGLVTLLSMCYGLKSLHVPDAISLSQTVLRHLPHTLESASLSVTFDDACMEARRGKDYAFPPSMPSLRHLHLQVGHALLHLNQATHQPNAYNCTC